MHVIAVNVGRAVGAAWAGRLKRTAIDKSAVVERGELGRGDTVEIVARPDDSVTVTESFRAYHGDKGLMRRLLADPGRSARWEWEKAVRRVLGRAS